MMLSKQDIENFCNSHNYLISLDNTARWIDQKCTPDVLTIIADCILNYLEELQNFESEFSTKKIWMSNYASENIPNIFKKPDVERPTAQNEYDKFFQQPMELFSFAGILTKRKDGHKNIYKVDNINVLKYIALREKNALTFLCIYIENVLHNNGLLGIFNSFFTNPTQNSYSIAKNSFSTFIIANTRINGTVECNRIFIKVINPLAYSKNTYGTQIGRISTKKITYDMLMYNRDNFRDIYSEKPRDIPRSEYIASNRIHENQNYYKYQSQKAKKFLKEFNNSTRHRRTEHSEPMHNGDVATHIHHIFPESKYPSISYYYENLIALTPTQHLNYAHPLANTHEINQQYQHLLLLSKTNIIQENLSDTEVEQIYDFNKLVTVLDVGFENDIGFSIPNLDFNTVVNVINAFYT